MGRSALVVARRARLGWLLGFTLVWSAGCDPEIEKLENVRSERATLGEEIYKVLCRRVAGTEMPSDLDGRETEALCLGDAATARRALEDGRDTLPKRVQALAERRQSLIDALDAVFQDDLGSDLEELTKNLLPFYDPINGEKVQEGTRVLARFLERLSEDELALDGAARWGRISTVPGEGALGLLRAAFSEESDATALLTEVLPPLTTEDDGVEALRQLLSALAFEMASAEIEDDPDLDRLKDLLRRQAEEDSLSFAEGEPLWVVERDARGMPVPLPNQAGELPYPFVDDDGDGLADAADGRFLVADSFEGSVPEPFAVPSEKGVARQSDTGLACALEPGGGANCDRALYRATDIGPMLLPAMLRTLAGFFEGESSAFANLGRAASALLGPSSRAEVRYGAADFSFQAPPSDASSSVINLVHAASALIPMPIYDESLAMFQKLLREHEDVMIPAVEPMLDMEKRTRPGDDQYPDAKLKPDHLFWDQMLWQMEKVSRWRLTADGETLLDAISRAMLGYGRDFTERGHPETRQLLTPAQLKHQGALLATMMRYKDYWLPNPRTESERDPSEVLTMGYFRTPVDRTQPDHPVSCGADGCGGPIKDTPFAEWFPDRKCVVQRLGQPDTERCGEPSNQSIFQRSMALLAEMAGRSQCNKAFTVGDLLDFAALEDPCRNLEGLLASDCTQDSDCPGGEDYACDTARGVCIAKSDSPACSRLKFAQTQDRQDAIEQAENALAEDYTCPEDDPTAPCHELEGYPAAFIDADGLAGPEEARVSACHLFHFPDVGRVFGKVMTGEFEMELPNPWVRRYLLDIARARNPDLPECSEVENDPELDLDTRITQPWPPPPMYLDDDSPNPEACIHQAARLARDLLETWKDCDDASYTEAEKQLCRKEGTTLGAIVEFMLDDSTIFRSYDDMVYLRPDSRALSRVLFGGNNKSKNEETGKTSSFALFDPLLLKDAPPYCADAPELPACSLDDSVGIDPPGSCCIKDPTRPPLRYQLDTYYAATSFAWEHVMKFTDGTELSFLDATIPVADAFNRLDYDADGDPPDDPDLFEDKEYAFTALGRVVAEHYDSEDNPFHIYGTGLVKYEPLLADLLDDGTIDYTQLANNGEPLFDPALSHEDEVHLGFVAKSFGMMELLETLDFNGRDGITLSTDVAEAFLSPHAYCAGEDGDRRVIAGQGACHTQGAGSRPPLSFRDGRDFVCWNDGRCFDGESEHEGEVLPKRFVSPLYLALDPISEMIDRAEEQDVRDAARGVLSGLIDAYGETSNDRLADRTLRSIALTLMAYTRERWAEEQAAGTLDEFAQTGVDDVIELFQEPVTGTALSTLYALDDKPKALGEMSRFLHAMLKNSRPLALWLQDLLNSTPGDDASAAFTRVSATTIADNVQRVIDGEDSALDIDNGMMWLNLELMRETVKPSDPELSPDVKKVTSRLMRNMAGLTDITMLDGEVAPQAPMYVLWDAILAINREDLLSQEPYDQADYRAAFDLIRNVLLDERRGFERLYVMLQCATKKIPEEQCE